MVPSTCGKLRTLVLAGAVAATTVALSPAPASAADKIHLGLLSLVSHSAGIIAAAKGYFAAEGLDAEFVPFQAAQPMSVAIASGDVDFGITAITGGLISLADKGVVKVIGGALSETPGVDGERILASKKAYGEGVTSPDKLKGRSFGITTTGSSFHYMAYKIAQKGGFSTNDLRLVPLQKVPAVVASLQTSQIDAWSIQPDIAEGLIKDGEVKEIGKIVDYIPDYQVTVIFTSTANISKRPDLVKRFLKAYARGIEDYNAALVDKTMNEKDTAEIVRMIHQYVRTEEPIEKAGPRIRYGAMRVNPGARLNLESVKDQLDWFLAEKMVPPESSMEKLVDTSFVQAY